MSLKERRVVITGMGIVSCLGNDIETYWNSLAAGVCGIDYITAFPAEGLASRIGGEVKNFHPEDFGLERPFCRKQDLFTIFAAAAAGQAMKDSALVAEGNIDKFRLGVNLSSGVGGIDNLSKGIVSLHEDPSGQWVSPNMIPTMIINMAAGQVAIRHQACGPCMNISTACASSTHAIGEAYRTILHGYADAMITGGTEHSVMPISVAAFANCKALTMAKDPKYASLPFNANRGGFVLADGAAVLILEEYEHAKARGAKIYAEICGYASTCDAFHSTAPRPDASTQARCLELAAKDADCNLDKDCIYVNAHGTGTILNDSTETLAYKVAFGEDGARKLHISSTKSMHGHMLGATGAAEAIATVLSLTNGIVPPTINLDTPDPACDLDYTPNETKKAGITLGLSDSFGFGGQNACIAFRKI